MSFRGRLTLFLLLIVVLPMVVIAVLASRVADDASNGKADARLFAGLERATAIYERDQAEAKLDAKQIGAAPALSEAIQAGDPLRTQQVAETLARENGVSSLVLRSADGEQLAKVGREPFASAQLALLADAERDVFLYLIGQAQASIENVALHEMVSEQAVTDGLTGLSNNREFSDVAYKEAARAERFSHSLSLLMLDIDDFKKVNDTHGHLQGDEVLRRIGRILRAESRGIDEAARYGGEEFVVALPETGPEGATELAERIRERIEEEEVPFVGRDGTLRITASLGVASIPDSAGDVQGLIAAADAALYAAKRAGKNRVEMAPRRAEPKARRRGGKASSGTGPGAKGRITRPG